MRAQRCGNCRFWARSEWAESNGEEFGIAGSETSECRRRAPKAAEVDNRPVWPWTKRTAWCGKFKRRAA